MLAVIHAVFSELRIGDFSIQLNNRKLMRGFFESLGVADVVSKSTGSNNPYNMVRATFAALEEQTSPRTVAQRRGKKVADLLARRGDISPAQAAADADAVVA